MKFFSDLAAVSTRCTATMKHHRRFFSMGHQTSNFSELSFSSLCSYLSRMFLSNNKWRILSLNYSPTLNSRKLTKTTKYIKCMCFTQSSNHLRSKDGLWSLTTCYQTSCKNKGKHKRQNYLMVSTPRKKNCRINAASSVGNGNISTPIRVPPWSTELCRQRGKSSSERVFWSMFCRNKLIVK